MEEHATVVDSRIDDEQLLTIPTKPTRRSHASRRAESRRRIIRAAIRCLNKFGYGGTTIDTILVEAKVSRGRLLNVFPTKAEIMVAVGAYVWEADRRYSTLLFRNMVLDRESLDIIVERSWTVLSRPNGIAVLEILVASRSDKELADEFVPKHKLVQAESIETLREIFVQIGVPKNIDAKAFHDFVEGCLRGLALDRPFGEEIDKNPEALELLKEQVRQMINSAD